MAEIENSLKEILKQVNKIDVLGEKIAGIEKRLVNDLEKLKIEVSEFKNDYNQQMKKQEYIGRQENLIIFGLEKAESRIIIEKFLKICKFLEVDIIRYDIKKVNFINRAAEEGPIRIKLVSVLMINVILKNKRKLATSEKYKQIRFKEDLPFEVRRSRAKLFPYLIDFKKQEKESL